MYIRIHEPEEWIDQGYPENLVEEYKRALPYLDFNAHGQLLLNGYGILMFESEEEMNHHYNLTIGDDGPTELNPYAGPINVYALTCNARGQLLSENT